MTITSLSRVVPEVRYLIYLSIGVMRDHSILGLPRWLQTWVKSPFFFSVCVFVLLGIYDL